VLADLRARLEHGLRRQALKKEKEEFTAEAEKSWMLANLQRDLNTHGLRRQTSTGGEDLLFGSVWPLIRGCP